MKSLSLRSRPFPRPRLPTSYPHTLFLNFWALQTTLCIQPSLSRSVATSRRTAKALSVKSAPTAAPASKRLALVQNTIVFNPPPTPPSPYQTPPLFLPPSDPRRALLAPAYIHENPYRRNESMISSNLSTDDAENLDTDLPTPIEQPKEKKYHLGAKEIKEIRRLRTSNPWVWTKKRLAEKFECSDYFISMCAPAVPERVEWAKEHMERVKARWGPKRVKAREEREKRKRLWQRDE